MTKLHIHLSADDVAKLIDDQDVIVELKDRTAKQVADIVYKKNLIKNMEVHLERLCKYRVEKAVEEFLKAKIDELVCTQLRSVISEHAYEIKERFETYTESFLKNTIGSQVQTNINREIGDVETRIRRQFWKEMDKLRSIADVNQGVGEEE